MSRLDGREIAVLYGVHEDSRAIRPGPLTPYWRCHSNLSSMYWLCENSHLVILGRLVVNHRVAISEYPRARFLISLTSNLGGGKANDSNLLGVGNDS